MISRINQPDTQADRELKNYLGEPPVQSFVMVSGAGSGKTTSLVKALAFLKKTKEAKLRPLGQKIACITYTEVAAGEILDDVGDMDLFEVSTIHSFLWTIVQSFQKDIREWVGETLEEKIAKAKAKIEKKGTHASTREKKQRDIKRYEQQINHLSDVKRFNYGTGSNFGKGILGHEDIIKLGTQFITKSDLLRNIVARQYPFVFVDESQDTFEEVVTAFRQIEETVDSEFCLGFFGDPMQKIYPRGVGKIPAGANWHEITKPENFRCSTHILDVINKIRAPEDDLQQVAPEREEESDDFDQDKRGTAKLFVLPADHQREVKSRILCKSPSAGVTRLRHSAAASIS
jgi:DNA helicase-2/ATP-dependent DNA helicase PcrA